MSISVKTTLENTIRQYLDYIYLARARGTAKTYEHGLKQFTAFLAEKEMTGETPLKSITVDHFIGFGAWLSRQKLKRQTRLVYVAAGKSLFDWLVIENVIRPSYRDMLRYQSSIADLSRHRESRLPRYAKQETIAAMLAGVRTMDKPEIIRARNIALLETLACTGCRINELAGAKLADIEFARREMKVTGKGSKERIVFLSETALAALEHYWLIRKSAKPSDPVFSRHGYGFYHGKTAHMTTKTIWVAVSEVMVHVGVKPGTFSPHYFRHAFATRMLNKTKNLALVQDMMGHASPASTRVYAKISTDDMREAHRTAYD